MGRSGRPRVMEMNKRTKRSSRSEKRKKKGRRKEVEKRRGGEGRKGIMK